MKSFILLSEEEREEEEREEEEEEEEEVEVGGVMRKCDICLSETMEGN